MVIKIMPTSSSLTLTGLLTVAIGLITTGADLINKGNYQIGIVLVVIGIGIMYAGIWYYEKGIIPTLIKRLKEVDKQ